MEIEVRLTGGPIAEKISPPASGQAGALVEFRGIVRDKEDGKGISALEYEAYPEMAVREIRRLLETLSVRHPCLAAHVVHRVGVVPVGETAIYVGITSAHRAEALALLGEFVDQLKKNVPVWKRRALRPEAISTMPDRGKEPQLRRLDEAIAEIHSHCLPVPAVHVPLADALGRVLRETVCAGQDLPPFDCSTRDGYAILADDMRNIFQVVDTIHAADWKPRQLKTGESVRVATGAMLPCRGLRVVMQENVERNGDSVKIVNSEHTANIRSCGEDIRAGQPLVEAGVRLNAGRLALLATAGCAQPLVSRRLQVAHFTTGDEIVPPDQKPKPGQIIDSNSTLIRGLLQSHSCDLEQEHLPEDFEAAVARLDLNRLATVDLILVSGGASAGDKDFTRALLERLGFKIIFARVNVRPGKPLIFGVNGTRVAFGLPGNPLSHFVCFHIAVATALARLAGESAPGFLRGRLAGNLDDKPCPRETLWPARLEFTGGRINLHPLAWASSADVTSFASAGALIRIPAGHAPMEEGREVDFLATAGGMMSS
jgi:molybdopterin molybdotransferase